MNFIYCLTILVAAATFIVPSGYAQDAPFEDPFGGKPAQLYTKTFKVPSNFVSVLSKAHQDPFSKPSEPDLMNSLRAAGVSFPGGGKASFNKKDSSLIVRTTVAEMDKISALVQKYGASTGTPARRAPKSDAERRLSAIVLPRVKFEDRPIEECVAYLVTEIKKHDPKKTGVPITLKEPKSERPLKLNLDLTDIPAYQALRFTAELAGLKLTTKGKMATIAP